MINIRVLKAGQGDCIILTYGNVKCYTERAVDKHPKIW